jgi:hypothetical protein
MISKMKNKIILLTLLVAVLLCACSKTAQNQSTTNLTTTTELTTTASTTQSSGSGLTYYDKNGKAHNDLSELPFYDKDNNAYYYVEDLENPYFVDSDNNQYAGLSCFIDSNGYFIYDEDGSITISDDGMTATDSNGTVYYPAPTVMWDVDGNAVSAFGFGDIIE